MILMDSAGFCDRQIPVLSTIGKGPRGEKGEKGTVDEQQVMDAVTQFIEEHPEYVTTVEDGAITERKLHDDSVTTPKIADESVTFPKLFDDVHTGYVRSFETVQDMSEADDLKAGMICRTSGYVDPHDGKSGTYRIVDEASSTIPEDDIIWLDGLFAIRVRDDDYFLGDPIGLVNRRLNVRKIGTIPNDPDLGNEQGCCCDQSGYLYVYYDGGTTCAIRKIRLSDLSIVNEVQYDTYYGHGNSMNYDVTTGRIIQMSSSLLCTVFDTDLNVISSQSTGTSSNVAVYSGFAMDAHYGMANVTGTNTFLHYYRLDNGTFFNLFKKTYPIPRYSYNVLQDCVIRNGVFFGLAGSTDFHQMIYSIGVTGTYIGNYIIDVEYEVEGLAYGYADNNFYVIDNKGNVFSINGSQISFTVNNRYSEVSIQNRNMCLGYPMIYANHQAGLDARDKYFHLVDNVQFRVPDVLSNPHVAYDNLRPILIRLNGVTDLANVITTASDGLLRIRYLKPTTGLYYSIEYSKSQLGSYQYISKIKVYDRTGSTVYSTSIGDLESDENLSAIVSAISTAVGEIFTFYPFGYTDIEHYMMMSNFLTFSV